MNWPNMKKYLRIMYVAISHVFTYRLSFILWRIRNVFNLIFIYFFFFIVFTNQVSAFSYTQEKLLTYILITSLLSSLVLLTRTADLSGDILSGDIIHHLLKPISFFKFIISREFADKLLNLFFTAVEISILFLILKPHIFIQSNPITYLLFLSSIVIGGIISFLISLNISFIAFWSSEIWAPRWIYSIFIWFLAGSFFPLDILPKSVYKILLLTPFPYLIFLPSKLYLDGFSINYMFPIAISIIWCFVLFFMTKKIWEKGIKNYNAYGR